MENKMQNQLKESENNSKQQKQTKSYTEAIMGFLYISRKIKINPTTDHLIHFSCIYSLSIMINQIIISWDDLWSYSNVLIRVLSPSSKKSSAWVKLT